MSKILTPSEIEIFSLNGCRHIMPGTGAVCNACMQDIRVTFDNLRRGHEKQLRDMKAPRYRCSTCGAEVRASEAIFRLGQLVCNSCK